MFWKNIGKDAPISILIGILEWMGYGDMTKEIKRICSDTSNWSCKLKYKVTTSSDKFVFRLNYTILNSRGDGKSTPLPDHINIVISKKFKFHMMGRESST